MNSRVRSFRAPFPLNRSSTVDNHGDHDGYLWVQDSPPIAKAHCRFSGDVCHLLHCIPALSSGWTLADNHTIDIHHRGRGIGFIEPRLECSDESLFWRVGRMCYQASGFCLSQTGIYRILFSKLDSAQSQELCYGPQLGYTIPTSLLSAVGLSTSLANVAETGVLVVLILHLVAAGLSTTVFLLSLFLHSHAVAIIALIIAIVTAIVGTVVFAADLAVVIVVRNNIDSLFSGAEFSVRFGNGVWMILTAMILTWAAVVVLSARACYCCGVRR